MSMEFLPRGFLQMIYVDANGFDKQHYKFEYERREFLGEVRCLVFDVTPLKENDRGRFKGRIWVEDQGFHIVRFNGAYQRPTKTNYFFHFDSWRLLAGDNQWLPAYVYCEETSLNYGVARKLMFKAQTRLWGYDLNQVKVRREQELNKVLVESRSPIKDQSETANDNSPLQEQRLWERQAEDNIADRMEKLGILSPRGDVDKVLETVVSNLEVTNNLDIEPEIRCRVLMSSTLESFVIGHTIVLSRGLIDVLPDEASLATILAMELAHVVLGHRVDTQYAFYDRMLWDDQDTFRHFGFARTQEEEEYGQSESSRAAGEISLQGSARHRAAVRAGAATSRQGDTQSDQSAPGRQSADRMGRIECSAIACCRGGSQPGGARWKGCFCGATPRRAAQVRSVERPGATAEVETGGHGDRARKDAV